MRETERKERIRTHLIQRVSDARAEGATTIAFKVGDVCDDLDLADAEYDATSVLVSLHSSAKVSLITTTTQKAGEKVFLFYVG